MAKIVYPRSLFSGARMIDVLLPKLKPAGDIMVRCPRCGQVGVLRVRRRENGRASICVYHGKGVSHPITKLVKNSLKKTWLEELLEEVI
jgi:uncharacterized C2H2 Zn-finger protein